MRNYNYRDKWQKMLTPEIVKKLTLISEYKGEQRLFIEAHKDELKELVEIAKIQSTEASNRIEGIFTADDRLKNLVQEKTTPRNRDESEIAGYRDIISKSLGARSKINMARATINALLSIKTIDQVCEERGKTREEILG